MAAIIDAPIVIAHRAAAPECPENSLCGIRAAQETRADIVEVDVRRSLDGMPFLLHDRTLQRTTTAHGPVRLLPARALKRVRLRGMADERLPSLAQALDALPAGVGIGLHLKDQGALRSVLRVVERSGRDDRVWLWLHRPRYVRAAKQSIPETRTVLLNRARRGRTLQAYVAEAESVGATAVSLPWGRLREPLISQAHDAGLLVFSVLPDVTQLEDGVAAGVDGVITSSPDDVSGRLLGRRDT